MDKSYEYVDDYKQKYEEQKLIVAALKIEIGEAIKAMDRYRRLYADPTYVKQFGREVTLDFDDPLYPYCPFRLTKDEIMMYYKLSKDNAQSKKV